MKKIFLVLILIAFVSLSGCGKNDDKTQAGKEEKKSEEVKKENTNSDAPVGDDKIKLNDLGITEGIPKNFPGDIPQPKNSKCIGSLSSSEGTVVNFESSDKIKELTDFFKEEMKKSGFDVIEGGEVIVSDDAAILGWKKSDRDVSVIMSFDKEKSKSQISITYK